ncbi:MAG: tRNA (N(6)-L-threonylcarbamoyladenosine(37)-C(2))-methylthiotransferase MtaB, partial [Clostridia bacterium]|nr:tRNA (N(6)-L-threonylcarbamoyladenosine(37)-C(2))-methylthiotransferase MtaB [Clostridia bacterium]
MKAVVFTLGCKVNESESDSLIRALTDRGYEVSDKLEPADIYIVNTCAVTGEAEKKSRQTVSRIKAISPNAKILFTGCAAQNDPKAFSDKQNVSVVTGTFNKARILDLLDGEGVFIDAEPKCFEEMPTVKTLRERGFIKAQDGCNNFCTYCLIPYLRGRERSRSPQSVLNEITVNGWKETVINGINLSSYDYEGVNLAGLLTFLKDVDTRIRLGSLEVGIITDEFLSAAKKMKNFAPHFHLSLQSGSDEVLKKMNRHYTAEEFYSAAALIRKYFPDAGITTDIIAGFPTETEENFNQTLDLIGRVEFSDIHPFTYSPRKGTVAYKFKDLSGDVKKARLNALMQKKAELKSKFVQKNVGKPLTVLIEEFKDGYSVGYTENYLRVYIPEKAEG